MRTCVLLVWTLFPCFTCRAAPTEPPVEKPLSVPRPKVVRTWGELKSQPAIKLLDGTSIRLGLESDEIPVNGVILVYGLLEGRKWEPTGSKALGPLQLRLTTPGREQIHAKQAYAITRLPKRWAQARQLLFVTSIRSRQRGRMLEFLTAQDRLIAKVQLTTSREKHQAWHSFDARPVTNKEGKIIEARYTPTGPSVVPVWDGAYPLAADVDGTKKKADDWKLPRSILKETDPRLQLTANGTTLMIRATQDVPAAQFRRRWIARWWINGKPMPVMAQSEAPGRDHSERFLMQRELKVTLDLSALKLKPEDRVEAQLLFCPFSWNYLDHGEMKDLMRGKDDWRAPALTNRITLKVQR